MDESELKSKLMKAFKKLAPHLFAQRIEQVRTSGTPEVTVTGGPRRVTTWIEVKYANPEFQNKEIQFLTMRRLDACGYARYVVYEEARNGNPRCTYVFKPDEMTSGSWKGVPGFDHAHVVKVIEALHE